MCKAWMGLFFPLHAYIDSINCIKRSKKMNGKVHSNNKQWLHEFLSRRRFYCNIFLAHTHAHSGCFITSENTTKIFIPPCHWFESTFYFYSHSYRSWGQFLLPASLSTEMAVLLYPHSFSSGGTRKFFFTQNNQSGGFNCLHLLHV